MARSKPRKRTGWFAKLLLVATAIGVARAEAAEAAEAGAEPSDPLGGQAAGQAAPNHCGAPATTPYHGSPWFEHDEAHAPIEPVLQATLSPARLQAEEAQRPPPALSPGERTAPVIWRGRSLGDVPLRMDEGRVSIATDAFLDIARAHLNSRTLELMPVLDVGGRLRPFALSAGATLRYDDATGALLLETGAFEPPPLPPTLEPGASAPLAQQSTRIDTPRAVQAPPSPPAQSAHEAMTPQASPPPSTTPTPSAPVAQPPPLAAQIAPPAPSPPPHAPPSAIAQASPPAPVTPPPPPPAPRQRGQLDFVYPLMIDDRYLGDIPVRTEADGAVSLPVERLITLIENQFDPIVITSIRQRAIDGRLRPFEDPSGFVLHFDEGLQELQVRAPGSLRTVETISIVGGPQWNAQARLSRAAPLSAYVTFDVTQSWDHSAADEREPMQGFVETGVRLFGDRGIFFEGRALYEEGAEEEFRRGDTRLVYDHVESMISASLGDVRYGASAFQSAPPMGGIVIERLFSLQPTRSYRPAGRRAIVLDRRTSVDVIVNGVEMRRLELMPGRYDLRDFPFVDGANDVVLALVDELGQRELIDMRGYFDADLLGPGISEFSYAYGALATSEAEGISYDEETTLYSMFHRIGVTSTLTLGINAQGRNGANLYGAEMLWASPIGTIGLDYASSDNPAVGTGAAALLRYEYQPQLRPGGSTWSFGLSSQWQDERFAAIDAVQAFGDFVTQNDATLRLYHPDWGTATFGLGYDQPRDEAMPGRYEASFTYARRVWGNLFGSFQIRHREEGDERETAGAISLAIRFDRRNQVTLRHDTRAETSELDWYRSGSYGVGGVSTNVRLGHNEATGESYGSGSLAYFGNRFEATLSNDSRTIGLQNEELASRTTARFGASIAYAGTQVAVGRPVRGAFAIVNGHESLEGRQIFLGGGGDSRPRAQSGWFGPALVPNLNPYSVESVSVDVDDLPPGYDLGAGQVDFRAYRGAGFDIRVGSDANLTVLAQIVDPSGAPVAMAGGELRSLDDASREPIQAFTNRNGRFVAAGVTPGRYQLVLFTDPPLETEINIDPASAGMVQLGQIQMRESP